METVILVVILGFILFVGYKLIKKNKSTPNTSAGGGNNGGQDTDNENTDPKTPEGLE